MYRIPIVDLGDLDPTVVVPFGWPFHTGVNLPIRMIFSLLSLDMWQPLYGIRQSLAKTSFHLRSSWNPACFEIEIICNGIYKPLQVQFDRITHIYMYIAPLLSADLIAIRRYQQSRYYIGPGSCLCLVVSSIAIRQYRQSQYRRLSPVFMLYVHVPSSDLICRGSTIGGASPFHLNPPLTSSDVIFFIKTFRPFFEDFPPFLKKQGHLLSAINSAY